MARTRTSIVLRMEEILEESFDEVYSCSQDHATPYFRLVKYPHQNARSKMAEHKPLDLSG
ncbi:hypothetical protein L484_012240 [Morus notabilis]|uniref:Uncharacterized protein n=1 Tax=Morus notabilis TaxID=981085 RepID=W9QZT9_9ROSA|nr:hypothetical protein L484_012240 [Morus notabilis]